MVSHSCYRSKPLNIQRSGRFNLPEEWYMTDHQYELHRREVISDKIISCAAKLGDLSSIISLNAWLNQSEEELDVEAERLGQEGIEGQPISFAFERVGDGYSV